MILITIIGQYNCQFVSRALELYCRSERHLNHLEWFIPAGNHHRHAGEFGLLFFRPDLRPGLSIRSTQDAPVQPASIRGGEQERGQQHIGQGQLQQRSDGRSQRLSGQQRLQQMQANSDA